MSAQKTLPPPEVSLTQICDLLAAHPEFRVVSARRAPRASGAAMLGWAMKEVRFARFGAVFSKTITLISFEVSQPQPRTLVMDLKWHFSAPLAGEAVFIHFLDKDGILRFQGDYSFTGENPDRLGFSYSRRTVPVPPDVAPGAYRVRLGVWLPAEGRHLSLGRTRGCGPDAAGGYRDAVLLPSFTI